MIYCDEHKYDDIIDMSHHVSKKHPQMPLLDRAAQFSPFAALTGHAAAISETARLTEECMNLDENNIETLDRKLRFLKEKLVEKPIVEFSYFKPDEKKNGGSYVTITGVIKKIDECKHRIFLDDGLCISINDLVKIEGHIFNEIIE